MFSSPLQADRVRELVTRFGSVSVLIVGDVMLDQFSIGRVSRMSPEAPVPVVEHDRDEYRIGGAGNVAHNVCTLGGRVELVGLVGSDGSAGILRAELSASLIGWSGLVTDPTRRTTTKQRIVTTRHQQVARIDYESDEEASPTIERALIEQIDRHLPHVQAVVISDYLKGTVTRLLASHVVEVSRTRGVPVLIDPKIPHIDYYAGATLVTPNHHEAEVAAHLRIKTVDDARRAGQVIVGRARCESVLITRGEYGMSLIGPSTEAHFSAVAREVADVTGAGDTVIATLSLSLAAGATLPEAVQLANHAAGIVVGRFGTAAVLPEELLANFGAH
jgi:D-beta-D-heptose 7-phosphate kinase/D-beta-D-heptose 1-phosphate adenosyltransferase